MSLHIRHPLAPELWLESSTKFPSWNPWWRTFLLEACFKPLFIYLDKVVIHFKFNQIGIPAELLLTGLSNSTGSTASMLYTEGWRGLPLLKCVLKYNTREVQMVTSRASLCKWKPSSRRSSWYFCLQIWRLRCPSMREISSGASDTRNSKLEDSIRLMCSTGLLMHDLIIDFDK